MNGTAKELIGSNVTTSDGSIGKIADLYFDDEFWMVRYFIVDTGGLLSRRQVLISPGAITAMDWDARRVDLALTREKVESAPDANTELPISRQFELQHNRHYGLPNYWSGGQAWGATSSFGVMPPDSPNDVDYVSYQPLADETAVPTDDQIEQTHLESMSAVMGYAILARDGELGRLEDFLLDDQDWSIQGLIVDTTLWFGGEVMLSLDTIEGLAWHDKQVMVTVDRDFVRNSPPVDLRKLRAND